MMSRHFRAGGPLPPDHPTYIARLADCQALKAIKRMDFIHFIAPRQIGKTSMLRRLKVQLVERGWRVAYCDLAQLKVGSLDDAGAWYAALERYLFNQLVPRRVKNAGIMPQITDSTDLKNQLVTVLEADPCPRPLVIIFDEVGSTVSLTFSDSFFSTLRSMHGEPPDYPVLKHLTFAFAGACDPRTLIKDPFQSPFNYGERIHLDDFSSVETAQLTQILSTAYSSEGVPGEVVRRIYYWTSGQPYLTQRLCIALEDLLTSQSTACLTTQMVDEVVCQIFLDPLDPDTNIAHIRDGLNASPALDKLFRRILAGDQVYADEEGIYNLYLLGAIKSGPDRSYMTVRNRIYEQAFQDLGKRPAPEPKGAVPTEEDLLEASSGFYLRLHQLTDHIARDLDLLKKYEDRLRYEGDPRRQAKYRHEIEQLRESVSQYQQEYSRLRKQVAGELPTEMRAVAVQLQQMDAEISRLLVDQRETR